jgi:hypothetical protein
MNYKIQCLLANIGGGLAIPMVASTTVPRRRFAALSSAGESPAGVGQALPLQSAAFAVTAPRANARPLLHRSGFNHPAAGAPPLLIQEGSFSGDPSPTWLPSSDEEGLAPCAGVVRPTSFSNALQKLSTEE